MSTTATSRLPGRRRARAGSTASSRGRSDCSRRGSRARTIRSRTTPTTSTSTSPSQHADDFLTGTSRDTTPEQGTLHLERESSSYPEWARPQAGDHVEALGSWIWDCDHYQGRGEKTEFHPFRAVWVARRGASPRSPRGDAEGDLFISSDPTPAGKQAECSHRDKGSDQFKACSHSARDWWSVNGTYRFTLCAPGPRPGASHLAITLVDKGSSPAQRPVVTAGKGGCADVVLNVDQPDGKRVVAAWQIFVGWSKPALKVDHLRLHFDRLLVRRAMDPSCAPDKPACPAKNESTLLGQIASGPGEWQLHWNVDGHLGPLARDARRAGRLGLQGEAVGRLLRRAWQAVVARHPRARV